MVAVASTKNFCLGKIKDQRRSANKLGLPVEVNEARVHFFRQ